VNRPSFGQILLNQRDLMHSKGSAAVAEIVQLKEQEKALLTLSETAFPLDKTEVKAFRANMVKHILQIQEIEETAVSTLREAIL
jgi:hypothetical protein